MQARSSRKARKAQVQPNDTSLHKPSRLFINIRIEVCVCVRERERERERDSIGLLALVFSDDKHSIEEVAEGGSKASKCLGRAFR